MRREEVILHSTMSLPSFQVETTEFIFLFIWFQSVKLGFNGTSVVWTFGGKCNFKQGGFVSLSLTLFFGGSFLWQTW